MSDNFLRAKWVHSDTAIALRGFQRLAGIVVSIIVLIVPVPAQQRSSGVYRHRASVSKQKSVSQSVPRSVPNSAVSQAAKPSGSGQELDQIERSSLGQAKSTAAQQKTGAPPFSHFSNTGKRNTPINFSYQRPSGAAKGNGTPNPARTR
jgi:hypothetical protein